MEFLTEECPFELSPSELEGEDWDAAKRDLDSRTLSGIDEEKEIDENPLDVGVYDYDFYSGG